MKRFKVADATRREFFLELQSLNKKLDNIKFKDIANVYTEALGDLRKAVTPDGEIVLQQLYKVIFRFSYPIYPVKKYPRFSDTLITTYWFDIEEVVLS